MEFIKLPTNILERQIIGCCSIKRIEVILDYKIEYVIYQILNWNRDGGEI